MGRLIFPESLKELNTTACNKCLNLTRVEFNGDTQINSFCFADCKHLTEIVFYKNPTNINDYAFAGLSDLILYSENSLYVEEYARKIKANSDNIKNLPPYVDQGILEKEQQETPPGFSGVYTLIVIVILLVDLTVVVLFSLYILMFSKRRRKRRSPPKYMAGKGTERQRPAAERQAASSESRQGSDTQRRVNRTAPHRERTSDGPKHLQNQNRPRTRYPEKRPDNGERQKPKY